MWGKLSTLTDSRFKMGYFRRSQKLWVNNKHDLDDTWDTIRSGERLTLWALGTADESNMKHTRTSVESDRDDNLCDRYMQVLL